MTNMFAKKALQQANYKNNLETHLGVFIEYGFATKKINCGYD
jgi:hypothetical protein